MPKIFISYRREDSKHAVGRLHAALKRHVRNPKRDIFMDIDNIPRGVDFVEHLDGQVAQCDIMLAIIGPGWLSAKDGKTGGRRLDDPGDFVRIEVASALKRGIPVVPVVLDDTQIPIAADLPDDLKSLARRNGERLEHESFDADVTRLIKNLPSNAPKAAPRPSTAAKRAAQSQRSGGALWVGPVVALGLLAIGGGAWAMITNMVGSPPLATTPEGEVSAATTASGSTLRADPPPAAKPGEVAAKPTEGAAKTTKASTGRGVGETFSDCTDCPQMVTIPAGSFMMGSPADEAGRSDDEGPQRRVSVAAFAAGKYEVTWTEYDRCVAAGGCTTAEDDGFGKGARPVTNVSWDDAKKYVVWLNGQVSGSPYRLLSEAEWEYAARAGTTTAYWWGGTASHEYANYGKDTGTCCDGVASGADRWVNTSPVGSFPPNAFGLNDMHGNVWEWAEDCYERNSYAAGQSSNGAAVAKGSCSQRVNRGGSWQSNAQYLRSAYHYGLPHLVSLNRMGFRVARTL